MQARVSKVVVLLSVLTGCSVMDGPADGAHGEGPEGSGGDSSQDPGSVETDPTICVPGVPVTTQVPLLTNAQYDKTILDLLGVAGKPSSTLAPDTKGSIDSRAWAGYKASAVDLAQQVMSDATLKAGVIPCEPAGDEAACVSTFVQTFGRRAFRRPLTSEEEARFVKIYAERAAITASGTFDEAIELILRSFLMSPSFLLRAEIVEQPDGALFSLSGYEVASRLSYMLWGTMPDEALMSAAANGVLGSAAGVLSEAQRMLTDPRAREMVRQFHREWLGMDEGTRWTDVSRDPAIYPKFTEAMVPAMGKETEAFVDDVIFSEGTFQDLITKPVAYVNADLAPIYDLDPAAYGSDLTRVELDSQARSGILTRTGFLVSHGMFNRTSPILRGAFIQKEILCTEINPPPPGVESTALPTEGLTTNRERVDAQTAPPACAECHHNLINPTGFALEAFDALGALQATDNGSPVDTSASIFLGDETVNVTGAVDFMSAVAEAPMAQLCYARHWVQFAYERSLTNEDSCTAQQLSGKIAEGYSVLQLISDLTQSDQFRTRAMGPAEAAQ